MSVMSSSYKDIIAEAESCFLRGKPGTFAVVRTPDGKLWYAAPGVQTHVRHLRIRAFERSYDEQSFPGTLIMRANRKKNEFWFVLYDSTDKTAPYIASSADEHMDFSCSIIAASPHTPGGSDESIVVQSVFKDFGSIISRIQNNDVAEVLLLQATNADCCEGSGNQVSRSSLHNQHGAECGSKDTDNDYCPNLDSLWGDEEDDLHG